MSKKAQIFYAIVLVVGITIVVLGLAAETLGGNTRIVVVPTVSSVLIAPMPTITATPFQLGTTAINAAVATHEAGGPLNCESASMIIAPAGCPFRQLPVGLPPQGP